MTPKEKLAALIAEKLDIEKKLEEAKQLESRLRELDDGWSRMGEITAARFDVRNEAFMPLTANDYDNRMVKDIDEKWIYVVGKYDNNVVRHRVSDGGKENTRGKYGCLDVADILTRWKAFKEKQP